MSSPARKRQTAEEYLALERQAQYKSEYCAGEIFAMAGASRWHNLIVANVIGELSLQRKGRPCTRPPAICASRSAPPGCTPTPHFPAIDCHLSLAEAYDKVDIVVT